MVQSPGYLPHIGQLQVVVQATVLTTVRTCLWGDDASIRQLVSQQDVRYS